MTLAPTVAAAVYDSIGIGYARSRRPDPRIAATIASALGTAQPILNVGAGTGSYESAGRRVIALEPSAAMIAQRPAGAAPVVQGIAEALPFADASFAAAMAILTVHHWRDAARGLAELRRVTSGPIVILTYDPAFRGFWLADYIPELVQLDEKRMPPLSLYGEVLGPVQISAVPIPHDCADGFLCAWWRRPAAYLDPHIRAGMSSFALIGDVSPALDRLAADLASGAWAARHAGLLTSDSLDLGYRLVVAG
jgi:SAM-dependent methyltransferase